MNKLYGKRKEKRDWWVRHYAEEHPQSTQTEIAHAFGISQAPISRILKPKSGGRETGITMSGQHILAHEIDKKADAKLMAAAPAMMETLREVLRVYEAHSIKETDPRYLKVKQVIAKAGG